MAWRWRGRGAAVGWISGVLACGPTVPVAEGGEDTSSGETTSVTSVGVTTVATTTSASSSSTTGVTTTTSTTSVDDGTSTSDDTADGTVFIPKSDGYCFTHCTFECDQWVQDCREGEKCQPWANDGGDQWNARRCSPLDPAGGQPGEACSVEGSGVSGIDDCDLSSFCWHVDPLTNEGVCVARCGGSEANPTCPGGLECFIGYEGVVTLCLPTCDALAPACGEGEACVAHGDAFFCLPSMLVPNAYDDPCDPEIGCGTGLVCAGEMGTPTCDASCCTALCDLDAPMCPDEMSGQTCVPYYERGQAPPGAESLGVCLVVP